MNSVNLLTDVEISDSPSDMWPNQNPQIERDSKVISQGAQRSSKECYNLLSLFPRLACSQHFLGLGLIP